MHHSAHSASDPSRESDLRPRRGRKTANLQTAPVRGMHRAQDVVTASTRYIITAPASARRGSRARQRCTPHPLGMSRARRDNRQYAVHHHSTRMPPVGNRAQDSGAQYAVHHHSTRSGMQDGNRQYAARRGVARKTAHRTRWGCRVQDVITAITRCVLLVRGTSSGMQDGRPSGVARGDVACKT